MGQSEECDFGDKDKDSNKHKRHFYARKRILRIFHLLKINGLLALNIDAYIEMFVVNFLGKHQIISVIIYMS